MEKTWVDEELDDIRHEWPKIKWLLSELLIGRTVLLKNNQIVKIIDNNENLIKGKVLHLGKYQEIQFGISDICAFKYGEN